jgi:hypothetical protein
LIDVPVRLGEVVVVSGQGIVRLDVRSPGTAHRRPRHRDRPHPQAARDRTKLRRRCAVAPEEARAAVSEMTDGRGADVTFEASGSPRAFATAIELTATRGTVVEPLVLRQTAR